MLLKNLKVNERNKFYSILNRKYIQFHPITKINNMPMVFSHNRIVVKGFIQGGLKLK